MQQRADSSDAARPIEHCLITDTYLDAAHAVGLTGSVDGSRPGASLLRTTATVCLAPFGRHLNSCRDLDDHLMTVAGRGAEVITLVLRPILTRFQLVCGTNLVSGSRCSKTNPIHKLEQYLPPNSTQFVVCGRRQASSRSRSNLASRARSGTRASIGRTLRSTTRTLQMPIHPLCLVPLWSEIRPNPTVEVIKMLPKRW